MNQLDTLSTPPIECICIPTTTSEIGQLAFLFAKWRILRHEYLTKSLIIILPGKIDALMVRDIKSLVYMFEIDKMFDSFSVEFCDIPPSDDIYIRDPETYFGKVPALGYKSGPNLQFFKSLEFARNYSFTYLHETDVYPIRKNWFEKLNANLRVDYDWIHGAHYAGFTWLPHDFRYHINGSAVYASGNKEFQNFLTQTWLPGLVEYCQIYPNTAYDIFLSKLSSMDLSYFKESRIQDLYYRLGECIRHISVSPAIANLSILTDQYPINKIIGDCSLKNSQYSLVHGRQFGNRNFFELILAYHDKPEYALTIHQWTSLISRNLDNIELYRLL